MRRVAREGWGRLECVIWWYVGLHLIRCRVWGLHDWFANLVASVGVEEVEE